METLVVSVLTMLGIVFAVLLYRPLVQTARLLEQRKRPRAERGRRFLDRMAARGWLSYAGPVALRGRDLREEDLSDAFLADADLSDADLRGVDLTGASLEGAFLSNADLRGAILTGANLTDARLTGARYDNLTRWPAGFDPMKHGAILVR